MKTPKHVNRAAQIITATWRGTPLEKARALDAEGLLVAPVGITPSEAASRIDALDADDPEAAHGMADDIVLAAAPPEVAAAYWRLVHRSRWWASA